MAKSLKPTARFSKPYLGVFLIIFAVIGLIVLIKTFAAPNPNLQGDLNNDNTVNITDLSILLSNYGTSNSAADINTDGTVSILDLSILLSHYGQSYTGSTSSSPPDPNGYFATQPAGSWSSLPSGSSCSQQVHRSSWEPRPENYTQNHNMPDAQAVHNSFAIRPRSSSYNSNWNNWLLPRVDGQFSGTTDEIIQWAACKWGISDNLLRGQAVRESTWYEGLHFSDGQCYWNRGCGDGFSGPTAASTTYCNGIAAFGHDYQKDTNSTVGAYPYTAQTGLCPQTFSIIGIKSWDDPAWQAPGPAYQGNQNGTFPFNRDSTAFAMDYEASYLRGCDEGWISWLPSKGDIWGCVGSWFSGDWHSAGADNYISLVQGEITNHSWLTTNFANGKNNQYRCDPVKGCPL